MKKYLLFFIPILVLACRQPNEQEKGSTEPGKISFAGDSLLKAKDAVISEELSRAYFAIGTYQGLKKEGLITEKGGIAGMGKVTEMNPDLRSALFSSVDRNEATEIPIAAKHVKLIGIHPSDSYKLIDTREVSRDNPEAHDASGGLSGAALTKYAP